MLPTLLYGTAAELPSPPTFHRYRQDEQFVETGKIRRQGRQGRSSASSSAAYLDPVSSQPRTPLRPCEGNPIPFAPTVEPFTLIYDDSTKCSQHQKAKSNIVMNIIDFDEGQSFRRNVGLVGPLRLLIESGRILCNENPITITDDPNCGR